MDYVLKCFENIKIYFNVKKKVKKFEIDHTKPYLSCTATCIKMPRMGGVNVSNYTNDNIPVTCNILYYSYEIINSAHARYF